MLSSPRPGPVVRSFQPVDGGWRPKTARYFGRICGERSNLGGERPIPTLQVGDSLYVSWPPDRDRCHFGISESPVRCVSRAELGQLIAEEEALNDPDVPRCPRCGIYLIQASATDVEIDALKSKHHWVVAGYDIGVCVKVARAVMIDCSIQNCLRCKTGFDDEFNARLSSKDE